MASKTIITPVLKFWGFARHPFDDLVLRDGDLDLFIDREKELRRLQNALSNSLSGVFGAQGVGKSSVLNKLAAWAVNEGHAVAVVQMSGTSENLLYQEILASILRQVKARNIKVATKLKLNVDQELKRLESSIKFTTSLEAGGKLGLTETGISAGGRQQVERELKQYTEDSAIKVIADLARQAKSPFIVMIDNLERAKYLVNDKDGYFRYVTKFAQIVDSEFSQLGVPFIVSLDQSFYDRIDGFLPGPEEAFSFFFGQLVEIRTFPPGELFKIINRRLNYRKWSGTVDEFIDRDAFWALMIATNGHPRRAFAVLREAMELIASKDGKRKLSVDLIRAACQECEEELDETEMRIFQFLVAKGPHSSSDEAFTKAVGIGRAQLRERLTVLQEKGLIGVTEGTSGTTKKDLYYVDDLDPA
jgi:hypothetical protein